MQTKNNPFEVYDLATYVAVALMMINYLNINLFLFGTIPLLVCRIIIVLLLIFSFIKKPTFTHFEGLLFLLITISMLIGFPSNYMAINLLFILLFIVCTRGISVEKVNLYSFQLLFFGALLTFALLSVGIISNEIEVVGDRERATFGYANGNAFPALVYAVVILYFYNSKKTNIFYSLIFLYMTYFVAQGSDNRTIIVSICVYFLALYSGSKWGAFRTFKLMSVLSIIVPFVLTLFSGYIVHNFPLIDVLFSNRLLFSSQFLDSLSILDLLIGGVSPDPLKYTIDNSFTLMLGSVGVVFSCIVMALVIQTMLGALKSQNIRSFALIVSFWSFSFSESSLVRPESIIGLVFWAIIHRSISERKVKYT